MSSTIEYDRKVLYLPAGSPVIRPDIQGLEPLILHFLFIKQGNIKHKRWVLYVSGWKYTIISTIGQRARSAEIGGLRFQNGYITPKSTSVCIGRKSAMQSSSPSKHLQMSWEFISLITTG